MKVLVFGTTGMLGSMVYRHLSSVEGFDVWATSRSSTSSKTLYLDASQPVEAQHSALTDGFEWDFWINCIGIIKPHCKDTDPAGVRNAIRVNASFPHELAGLAGQHGIRLIQIATDCVYSGKTGAYIETDPHDALDVYGKTKSLGEVFDGGALNLRVSIIGPENGRSTSLLEWFLGQASGAKLNGFTHHRWNGITTLRFAQLCEAIIREGAYEDLVRTSHVHHYVPVDVVDKYALLNVLQAVFQRDYVISAVGDVGPAVDRTLATKFSGLHRILPPITIAEDVRALGRMMPPPLATEQKP